MSILKRFWHWVDERSVVRRAVLGITLWMTWRSFVWAATYAETGTSDSDTALIIAAVLVPISTLQGAAFKHYTESKQL